MYPTAKQPMLDWHTHFGDARVRGWATTFNCNSTTTTTSSSSSSSSFTIAVAVETLCVWLDVEQLLLLLLWSKLESPAFAGNKSSPRVTCELHFVLIKWDIDSSFLSPRETHFLSLFNLPFLSASSCSTWRLNLCQVSLSHWRSYFTQLLCNDNNNISPSSQRQIQTHNKVKKKLNIHEWHEKRGKIQK